MTKADFALLDI